MSDVSQYAKCPICGFSAATKLEGTPVEQLKKVAATGLPSLYQLLYFHLIMAHGRGQLRRTGEHMRTVKRVMREDVERIRLEKEAERSLLDFKVEQLD